MKKYLSLLIILPVFSFSQSIELDSVTVKATPRNTFTINGNQLKSLPVHSIDELLRYMPGIEVQQRGPQGSQADILMRGGTFQQVLVVIDNIRVNDPLTGHFNSYIPVTPSEIDHIEILYGAASAIYGSEAVGGVIRIFTKAFAANKGFYRRELSGEVTAGEYGLINLGAGGNYQANSTVISAGILTNNASGQPLRGMDGYFHNTTASFGIKQLLNNNWNIAYQGSFDKRNFAAQNFYTVFTSDTATEKVTTWWNHLQVSGKHLSIDVGYKQLKDEYDFSKAAMPNNNHSKILQGLALYNFNFLKAGVQFLNQSIRSNDRGNHSVSNIGVFVLSDFHFKYFTINPALRTDWNENAGWQFMPQLSLAWRRKNLLLRGSAGKATRKADFTEQYNNYKKTLVTSGNIGNPNLQAEHSWNYEAGADYTIIPSIKLSATYFLKKYSNLIDWSNTSYSDMPRKDNLSPMGSYYLAKNISFLNTNGIETFIQASYKNLYSVIGLTIINSDATQSLYISSHAKLSLNYSIRYQFKWLQLSTNGLYKLRDPQTGSQALAQLSKDYFVMNARADAYFKKWFGLFIQCDNVFNRIYADRFGTPMPGRWLMAGLKVELNK